MLRASGVTGNPRSAKAGPIMPRMIAYVKQNHSIMIDRYDHLMIEKSDLFFAFYSNQVSSLLTFDLLLIIIVIDRMADD